MRKIEDVLTDFNTFRDKVQWIKMYVEHSDMVSKRATEIFFRSTQIPRDSKWRDPIIIDLIEISDRHRELYDGLHRLYELTIGNDINNLLKKLNERINLLKKHSTNREELLSVWLSTIKEKKDLHYVAWTENKLDPWYTEYDLKKTIKKYLKVDLDSNNELKEVVTQNDELLRELNINYKNIALNYIKIQKTHFSNISESLDSNLFDAVTFSKSDIFYDFPDSEACDLQSKDNKGEDNINEEVIYNELVVSINEELKSLKKGFIKKKFRTKKYGFFNIKKHNGREYKPMFLILTENNFIHCYDISAKPFDLTTKLLKISQKTSPSFFDNSKIVNLTQQDEKELKNITEIFMKEIDFTCNVIKGFPIQTTEKLIKLHKEKSEINITSKKSNNMLNIFWDSSIKIKGYTLKDIYELYFAILNENKTEEKEKKFLLNNQQEKDTDTTDKGATMEKISENILGENPWRNY
ncbi:hypothetical protein SLOPH_1669 [Spraguea lophii 42_110]|uniref:Uncharacterized protein n=1 Tax=Spraguea lophii (strain 42_110) TaxID=1358809 RepID=S7W9R0_SPRLO|nr:hypothetical protein SLOPH_1669 [Spraguea lophii 42_110]